LPVWPPASSSTLPCTPDSLAGSRRHWPTFIVPGPVLWLHRMQFVRACEFHSIFSAAQAAYLANKSSHTSTRILSALLLGSALATWRGRHDRANLSALGLSDGLGFYHVLAAWFSLRARAPLSTVAHLYAAGRFGMRCAAVRLVISMTVSRGGAPPTGFACAPPDPGAKTDAADGMAYDIDADGLMEISDPTTDPTTELPPDKIAALPTNMAIPPPPCPIGSPSRRRALPQRVISSPLKHSPGPPGTDL
jgi:hypothetical protein